MICAYLLQFEHEDFLNKHACYNTTNCNDQHQIYWTLTQRKSSQEKLYIMSHGAGTNDSKLFAMS